jgi:hypothetical protein
MFPIRFSESFFPFLALSYDRHINTTTLQTWASVEGSRNFTRNLRGAISRDGKADFGPPPEL